MRYLLFLALITLAACGGNSETEAMPANPYEAAAKMARDQMEGLQQNNGREVHEAATVKEMLPEKLLGMTRKSISSNGVGAAGFRIATATATYQNEGEQRRITITITDGMGGNLPGMGMINSFTVDKEEGTKTTTTITLDGKKAIREYDTATNRGSLNVVFPQSIVQIEGRYLEGVDELEDAFDALSLRKL